MTMLLYILLALSLAGGVLTKITPITTVNIYAFDILAGLILIINIKKIATYIKQNSKPLIVFYLFILANMVSVSLHTSSIFEFISAVSYLGRIITYVLLFVPLLFLPIEKLLKIRKWMLITGIIFVLLGYIQYAFYPNLRNLFYLGWDEHLYRLFSTFLDPNFSGVFIALIICLYSWLFFEKLQTKKNKILYYIGFAYFLPALFLTYSRSSILVFIISFTVFLFMMGRKKLIALFVVFIAVGIIILPKDFGGEGVNLLRSASIIARVDASKVAFQVFLDNPLLGVGFNTLRFTFERYGFVTGQSVLASHSAAGVPNSYLVILATTGILGFLTFIYFLYNLVQKVRVVSKEKKIHVFSISTAASIMVVLLGSLFENVLLYAPIMIWMILLMGMLYGLGKKIKAYR